jgi:hypothetical protein
LQKFGYDSSKVRNYLLNVIGYNKSNVSKVMKDFDSEISRIKSHHSKESIFQVVQEIREMLRVA